MNTETDPVGLKKLAGAISDGVRVVEKAGRFVSELVGPASTELSGLLTDQMKYWRALNLNRLAEKYETLRCKNGFHLDAQRRLPFATGYLLLEAASVEESGEILDLWASLLLRATDPASSFDIRKHHISLLKEIGAAEAAVLRLLYDIDQRPNEFDLLVASWQPIKVLGNDASIALQNLIRHRISTFKIITPENLFSDRSRWRDVDEEVDRQGRLLGELNTQLNESFSAVFSLSNYTINFVIDENERNQFSLDLIEIRRMEENFGLTLLGLELMKACSYS